MAEVRHAFVSPDGRTRPEWCRLARSAAFLSFAQAAGLQPGEHGLFWVYVGNSLEISQPALDLIRRLAAATPCIALADAPNDAAALAALEAGARGYLNGHANSKALRLVGNVVIEGGLWIGESLMRRMVLGLGRANETGSGAGPPQVSAALDPAADSLAVLTQREREVAEQIAGGASNREIALRLNIAERTVKAHITAIFDKLGVDDRLKLALKIMSLRK
ncbi:MAG: response regulator transcription factor [Candidatus Parcubacteria bacterium]|nr:response regulator transcription factor [Burkholderiales bacterium]